jgi:rare lipoprotein A
LCGIIGFSVAFCVLSATALAEGAGPAQIDPATKQPAALDKAAAKPKPLAKAPVPKPRVALKPAVRRPAAKIVPHSALAGPPDRYLAPASPVGPRQIGRAAWYGGFHVGLQTASGAVLDTVHPTAAHRTLPLNTLVRVTNMKNGRSVVVLVNDRGPVSPSLIIDLSPRAAQALDMIQDGIVPVSVEPVATQQAAATAQ